MPPVHTTGDLGITSRSNASRSTIGGQQTLATVARKDVKTSIGLGHAVMVGVKE